MDDWRKQAACLGMSLSWFVPDGQGLPARDGLLVCMGCSVRVECLEAALAMSNDVDDGVWGGTTPRVRREVRAGRMSRGEAMVRGDRVAMGVRNVA
jgi:WhiB family transcriptional regulator, redox-sensing transcriptional regulator